MAFPEELRDVDYFIPVKNDKAGEHLEAVLQQIENQVNKAAKRGEYPITYAVYVRYLKGTNGGDYLQPVRMLKMSILLL